MYKESVMHVQSYCFTYLNLIAFLPFSLNSPASLRKLPMVAVRGIAVIRASTVVYELFMPLWELMN